jgi:hypothetical protein
VKRVQEISSTAGNLGGPLRAGDNFGAALAAGRVVCVFFV